MLDNLTLERVLRAFTMVGDPLYSKLWSLSESIMGDHIEYMHNRPEAIRFKILQSIYVGTVVGHQEKILLDFGSGCGFLACVLASTGASRVIGVDIAKPRIDVARFLAHDVFQIDNVDFIDSIDAIDKESLNAALLINSFSHVYRPLKVITDVIDRLKAHGRLYIVDNNNLASIFVRIKLRNRVWSGEGLDGEHTYHPLRVEYLKNQYQSMPDNLVKALADKTYGMTFKEISRFVTAYIDHGSEPFSPRWLRNRAPVHPARETYHENAFSPSELEMILANAGLVPIYTGPKYVFDFKQSRIISFMLRKFASLSLRVCPAFEILAIKK
jgi:SAM-dependent methyltransferase